MGGGSLISPASRLATGIGSYTSSYVERLCSCIWARFSHVSSRLNLSHISPGVKPVLYTLGPSCVSTWSWWSACIYPPSFGAAHSALRTFTTPARGPSVLEALPVSRERPEFYDFHRLAVGGVLQRRMSYSPLTLPPVFSVGAFTVLLRLTICTEKECERERESDGRGWPGFWLRVVRERRAFPAARRFETKEKLSLDRRPASHRFWL